MTPALQNPMSPAPGAAAAPFTPLKAAALELYRTLSQPQRRRMADQQAAQQRSRLMVFFYHRVAEQADSALTLPFSIFRRQIDWLRQQVEMVSLEETIRRMYRGSTRPTAHITFDDGYAENCRQALPYLVANAVPTTYFVSSWHIQTGTPFAHDVKQGHSFAVNTPEQIRALADAGIEIGAHTRRHVDLGTIEDEAMLRDEIIGSKQDLEEMIGRPVRYFAFPFGTSKQLTAAALRIAREAGFEAVCSAVGGYNFPGQNAFHLQRIHGDLEMSRFRNWATLDPRKVEPQLILPEEFSEPSAGA